MTVISKGMILAAVLCLAALATLAPQSYAAGGTRLWTNRYNDLTNGTSWAVAIAVDDSGNVFVTGYSEGDGSPTDYSTVAYSGAGVPLWTNRYNGPANGYDEACAVAVDSSGNVFVTGYSQSDGGPSDYDYATVAYSNAGVPLWTNRYDGPANNDDRACALAVDSVGNVFVTGSSVGSNGDYDYATVAYSNAGVPLWTNRYDAANGYDAARRLAVDWNGNVIVSGASLIGTNLDYATIAYSNAGLPLWTNRYDGPGHNDDEVSAIAVDYNGNVFVTGLSWSGTNWDYATVAYSVAGVPLWTNRYDGPGNSYDGASGIAVDSAGNVFVTGDSVGMGSSWDYATVAYSGAGVSLWTNRYNGPGNDDDEPVAVVVDRSGNVFVTGISTGSTGDLDYATLAYSGAGAPLWINRYNGPGNHNDYARAMAVDRSGNVFVTGASDRSTTFPAHYDFATIKYSSSVPTAVPLDFQLRNNQLVLSWTNSAFDLQTAPVVTGAFTNIPGATSPHTNLIMGSQQYFRLKAN